jgi:hypothetical protein
MSRAWSPIRATLPEGGSLPNEIWDRRHRGIVALLWLHVVGIPVYGLIRGVGPIHIVMEASIVALATLAASTATLGRKTRSVAATLGLFSSSAIGPITRATPLRRTVSRQRSADGDRQPFPPRVRRSTAPAERLTLGRAIAARCQRASRGESFRPRSSVACWQRPLRGPLPFLGALI